MNMRNIVNSVAILLLFGTLAWSAGETNFTTKAGQSYTNATLIREEPDGLSILIPDKGVIKLQFEDLSEDIQRQYKYDPSNAAAYTEKMQTIRSDAAKKASDRVAEMQKAQEMPPAPPIAQGPSNATDRSMIDKNSGPVIQSYDTPLYRRGSAARTDGGIRR